MPGTQDTLDDAEQGPFRVIDAQVHMWERDHPSRPWDRDIARAFGASGAHHYTACQAREMGPEDMLRAMSDAGVDAAIAVSPFIIYGYDASLAFEAAKRYPNAFRVVTPFRHDLPDLAEQLDIWQARPGAAGIRVIGRASTAAAFTAGQYVRLFGEAERRGIPICVYRPGAPGEIAELARRHPDLQLVVDHLGLPGTGDPTWSGLGDVLALAEYPNVAIKATGAVVHSAEPFPFADIWQALDRILDTFGVERVLWGTDWTRVETISYADGVGYMRQTNRLRPAELRAIMGGNAARIFGWSTAT